MTTFSRTRTIDSSSSKNNSTEKTNKFKTFISYFICIILVLGVAFGFGYYQGTERVKNKKIAEIQYNLSPDYELDEWQILEMAIAKTESEFNQYAVGKTNDFGIIQITPPYVKDVNRISGKHYQISDAFDIKKSLEMFSLYQAHYNPTYDIDKAMHLHNPNGASIHYFDKVYSNIVFIKRMESVRKEVLLNNLYKNTHIVAEPIAEIKDSGKLKDSAKIVKSTISTTPVEKIKVKK